VHPNPALMALLNAWLITCRLTNVNMQTFALLSSVSCTRFRFTVGAAQGVAGGAHSRFVIINRVEAGDVLILHILHARRDIKSDV
jgi:hypothetical protein